MKDEPVILVVDDNILDIEAIETYLAPRGYEIVRAATGEEALKKLSVNKIDLILLALTTSGMDGFEVIRRVRQNNAYQLLPILLITACCGTKDQEKAIKAGCDDFICKPFNEMVLLARIRSILTARTYHDLMDNYVKVLEANRRSTDNARKYAENIINTIHEPLIFMDQELRVISANRSFYEIFRENPENIVGEFIYNLGNKQEDLPRLRKFLETILQQKTTFHNYEVEYDFATIGKRTMLLNARQIKRELGNQRIILLAIEDITERKQSEELKELNEALEEKIKKRTSSLQDVNTALRILLAKRDEDKNKIDENINANFKSIIQPLLSQLRNCHTKNVQEEILNILESTIKEMTTPFSKRLSDPMVGLTPTEIQIATLVKEGKINKEITEILNKSIRAVSSHRNNIRQKLGLKNKKINLRTYLLSMD